MKLFKSLLVAPATLGLLAPMSATASEVTISDFNAAEEIAVTNSRIDGLEARFNNLEAGSFSETTTASFGVEFVVGAVDSEVAGADESVSFDYTMGIGLETSFTGEDSLSATIDIGSAGEENGTTILASDAVFNYNATDDALVLDGLTYTFPVGGATVMVGDNTDISALYTGACAYNSFTDYAGNCGTGNSVGVGGEGATAAMSYAFDSGFSLAGGISSTPDSVLTADGDDTFGMEVAYTADSWGVAVAYSDIESEEATFWGINGMYAFDFATLSVGLESENPEDGDTGTGFFVGLSFPEVGAGSFDLAVGTTGNFADGDEEFYAYEASYAYPVNDGMTITPGVAYTEGENGDSTVFAVKTSFSF
jgi:hypothetical protein